jgi:peptide chain release factor 2
VLRERSVVQSRIKSFHELEEALEEIGVYLEMAAEGDEDGIGEAERRLDGTEHQVAKLEFERMLSGEHDLWTGPRCCCACCSAGRSAVASRSS